MAEIRRGFGGDASRGDKLPWLEPVEDEYEPEPQGNGGLAVIGIALLVLIGLAIGGFVWFRHWSASRADVGQVIHAPAGPYKERPKDPGGLQIDANGAVAEHAGIGGDIDAPLDLAALPEKPITGPGSEPGVSVPAPAAPAAKPAAPAPTMAQPAPAAAKPAAPVVKPVVVPPAAKPAPEPAEPAVSSSGGGTIQLGALASEAKAKQVWKTMSGRFGYLAPLTMSITPVKVGDNTLYRLRASGGDARAICAKLKVAGEACTVVSG